MECYGGPVTHSAEWVCYCLTWATIVVPVLYYLAKETDFKGGWATARGLTVGDVVWGLILSPIFVPIGLIVLWAEAVGPVLFLSVVGVFVYMFYMSLYEIFIQCPAWHLLSICL